jgi:hypothetical protein
MNAPRAALGTVTATAGIAGMTGAAMIAVPGRGATGALGRPVTITATGARVTGSDPQREREGGKSSGRPRITVRRRGRISPTHVTVTAGRRNHVCRSISASSPTRRASRPLPAESTIAGWPIR